MRFPGLQLREPLWSRLMISSIFPQSSQMTSNTALKLKPHCHSNHLLYLFSNLNNQSSHGPGYMWTLLARSIVVAFWSWLMPIPNGQKFFQCRMLIAILKQLFSQHGLPETVSDNGSLFTSETFSHFCSSCWITHLVTTLTPTIQ